MKLNASVGLNCSNRTKISRTLYEDLRIIMAVSHHLRNKYEYKKSPWKTTRTKHDAFKTQFICEKQTSFLLILCLIPSILWDVTQRWYVLIYRRFGTHYKSSRVSLLTLEDRTDRLFRKSVTNYQSTLRNMAEGRRSHLHRGRSLKQKYVAPNFIAKRIVCGWTERQVPPVLHA
jgi:hypothetical protein